MWDPGFNRYLQYTQWDADKGSVRYGGKGLYSFADGSVSLLDPREIPCTADQCWWSVKLDGHDEEGELSGGPASDTSNIVKIVLGDRRSARSQAYLAMRAVRPARTAIGDRAFYYDESEQKLYVGHRAAQYPAVSRASAAHPNDGVSAIVYHLHRGCVRRKTVRSPTFRSTRPS